MGGASGFDSSEPARLTLLIADDDPVVRSMLSMSLEHLFEIVAAAPDSEQAVAEAAALQPDAAVIDVDMPGGGGRRAVRGIVEASPDTAIVVLSGDESDALIRELVQAGAMAYRRKGVAPSDLAQTLQAAVRARRAERADLA